MKEEKNLSYHIREFYRMIFSSQRARFLMLNNNKSLTLFIIAVVEMKYLVEHISNNLI